MSTVMARRVASTPVRSASETWATIVFLLVPDPSSADRAELAKAEGVACASIASEATKDAAIIVWGGGPRARIYCLFGDDAITGDDVSEDAFARTPLGEGWKMSIPCPPEDLAWSRNKLASTSLRVSARSVEDDVPDDGSATDAPARSLAINFEEFLRL